MFGAKNNKMYLAPRLIIVLKMAFIQSVKLCITCAKPPTAVMFGSHT